MARHTLKVLGKLLQVFSVARAAQIQQKVDLFQPYNYCQMAF